MSKPSHHWLAALIGASSVVSCSAPQHGSQASTNHHARPAPRWSYSGDTGPDHWGSLDPLFAACGTGHMQSPIDIQGGLGAIAPAGHSVSWTYSPAAGSVLNTGRTIQTTMRDAGALTIDGVAYQYQQFHFHAPAEHRISGVSVPMEMHLVHRNASGGLAVLAVLLREGQANAMLDRVMEHAASEVGEEQSAGTLDVREFVPTDGAGYYRYEGSLTAPPCTEGVQWIVLREPREVSRGQVARFTAIVGANARPLQEAGTRVVEVR